MRNILRFLKLYHKFIFVSFLFLFTIAAIVYIFPKSGKFRYEFQKGKPWMHETFYAPFDFAILKSDHELKAHKDSIERNVKPFFKYNTEVHSSQLNKFVTDFDVKFKKHVVKFYNYKVDTTKTSGIDNFIEDINENKNLYKLKVEYFDFSKNLINFIYTKGVIDIPEAIKDNVDDDFTFVFVFDNLAEEFNVSEVFTINSAKTYINEQIQKRRDSYDYIDNIDIDFFENLNLNDYIIANLAYDEKLTKTEKIRQKNEISLTRGMVQKDERIISKGDKVGNKNFLVLTSLKNEYETLKGDKNQYLIIIGQVILVLSSILVIFLFLYNFRRDVLENLLKTSFVLILVTLFVFIASVTIKSATISLYVVPFAVLPIIIRTFYDTRLALFIHIVTMLIIGFLAPNSFEFVFIQIIVGIIALFSLANVRRRGQLFIAALFVFITYSIIYLGIGIIQEGEIKKIELINFAWFAGNGMLVLMSYPLIYLFEKVFGFLSDVTLMELSDTNTDLLRQLAEKAPGTFQHSLQVANLAEEVIYKIGGNPLLVRTGALYHDVGKIANPIFFIENQNPGMNPHDNLEFDKSADIIIGHIKAGVELAKKAKIPEKVIDFIRTHHGDSIVQYFYKSYINKYPDADVDISMYTYPGPKPYSKETAVLMMADAVEAASRSLKSITEDNINELVENLIDYQMKERQFDEADLTFKDISVAKQIFKTKLKNIYHARIEYPK